MNEREKSLRRRIKVFTWAFIIGLALSGATAIPLKAETGILVQILGVANQSSATAQSGLAHWILLVREALVDADAHIRFSRMARIGWRSDIS